MDPRLLLNPKLLKKAISKNGSAKKTPHKVAEDSRLPSHPSSSSLLRRPQTPKSSNSSSSIGTKTSPDSIRSYDPRALLNPRGSQKSTNPQPRNPPPPVGTAIVSSDEMAASADNAVDPNQSSSPGSNVIDNDALFRFDAAEPDIRHASTLPQSTDMPTQEEPPKRLLLDHFGVESRNEQPRKKVKVERNGDAEDDKARNSFQHKSSGVVGEYMKQQTEDKSKQPPNSSVVDLTNDDDDDIQIVGSRSKDDEIVCYGRVPLNFDAYIVPKPKKKPQYISDALWPHILCELIRKPEHKNVDAVIDVVDPFDVEFAKVHAEQAAALSKAMDWYTGLRVQPMVLPRPKRPADWPHQSCSYAIRGQSNIYGRRGDVERVGRLFGQYNLWFVSPTMPDKGFDVVNPHAQKKSRLQAKLATPGHSGQIIPDSRTNEEVAQHMANMMDEWSKKQARELPETYAPALVKTELLPHQKQGLTFMLSREKPRTYDDTEESFTLSLWRKKIFNSRGTVYEDMVSGLTVTQEPEQVFGGLLADVMGLGKTLEALSLVASTIEEAEVFGKQQAVRVAEEDTNIRAHAKATLLVCPTSTVQNWDNQIKEHLDTDKLTHYIYHGQNRTSNAFDLKKYDVVVTTYGTVASDFRGISSPLRQLKWFRVILDEAHTIREQKAQQSQACYMLNAQRRWCLTGTPIQNRISDLGSLTKFLRLYPYNDTTHFNQYIGSKASAGDISYLDKLRLFVDSFCLRRTREIVDLPKRVEIVTTLTFSESERKMHDHFKERAMIRIEQIMDSKDKKSGVHLHMLKGITTLRLICAHGRDLLKEKDLKELQGMTQAYAIDLDEEDELPTISKREAYEDFSLMAEADQDFCSLCSTKLTGESPQANGVVDTGVRCYVLPCKDTLCANCFSNYKELFDSAEGKPMECPFCSRMIAAQYVAIDAAVTETLDSLPDDELNVVEDSKLGKYSGPQTKVKALLEDINVMKAEGMPLVEAGERPLKCVVFSEFTSNLSLIERGLSDRGYTFARIDGSMSLNARRKVLETFDEDDALTILLASIKAAGQGLNLTAASRAFIMEPMWNPAAEEQAVDRIYRIGQKRDVIIRRYRIEDSIETKIAELARKKTVLANAAMGSGNQKKLTKSQQRLQNLEDIKSLFK